MSINTPINVLITGAGGKLGQCMLQKCLQKENLIVNATMKNPDAIPDLSQQIINKGGKVIPIDLLKSQNLKPITQDIHTVISTLIGNNDQLINAQNRLINDSIATGVNRMVLPDYCLDYTNIDTETFPQFDYRIQYRDIVKQSQMKGIHIFCGLFAETFFQFQKSRLFFIENIQQKFDLTTYEDCASFVAEVISDETLSGDFRFHSFETNIVQVGKVCSDLFGKEVVPLKKSGFETVRSMIKDLRENGNVNMANFLSLQLMIFKGEGKLMDVMNSQFKNVKTTTLEELIENDPDLITFEFNREDELKAEEERNKKQGNPSY